MLFYLSFNVLYICGDHQFGVKHPIDEIIDFEKQQFQSAEPREIARMKMDNRNTPKNPLDIRIPNIVQIRGMEEFDTHISRLRKITS